MEKPEALTDSKYPAKAPHNPLSIPNIIYGRKVITIAPVVKIPYKIWIRIVSQARTKIRMFFFHWDAPPLPKCIRIRRQLPKLSCWQTDRQTHRSEHITSFEDVVIVLCFHQMFPDAQDVPNCVSDLRPWLSATPAAPQLGTELEV